MKHTDWYKDAVIYQIYPRSFCDGNGDGLGDIRGIISKLDYLKDLGINCVWLSPVYDSPQEDNGYDIANYKDIYPPFGTLDDFKEMLEGMHQRGIRLIMDLVVNHTSSEHAWFEDIKNNQNSKFKDYYIIRHGKKNGKKPPNNWTGFFGEKAWSKLYPDDKNNDEYYLHLFAKGQPDLNWENVQVREEVKSILKFWLDMGVDGFRCDVITLISKKQDFKDRHFSIALIGKDAYVNGPRLHEFLHELYKDVYANYDCMTVGETVLSTQEDAKLLVKPEREELSMIFNFDHTDIDNYFGIKWFKRKFNLVKFKKIFNFWQTGMYNEGWNSLFIENHDQRRSTGRFGTDESDEYRELSAKMLACTYFLMQGTPFIYEGQEFGMTGGHFNSINELQDVEAHNIYNLGKKVKILWPLINNSLWDRNRDNARVPVSWDDSKYAGFSNVKPWLRCNENKNQINAKESIERKDSLFHFYQALIKYRIGNSVIKNGKYLDLMPKDKSIFAYSRKENDKVIIVISNFSKNNRVFPNVLKKYAGNHIVFSNYNSKEIPNILRPYEVLVLQNY